MPDVLHRTTKELRRSAKLHLHPIADWIHDPDLSLVIGQPAKYWKIVGDSVLLQTAPEQAATDAAILAATKANARNEAELPIAQEDSGEGIRWRSDQAGGLGQVRRDHQLPGQPHHRAAAGVGRDEGQHRRCAEHQGCDPGFVDAHQHQAPQRRNQ